MAPMGWREWAMLLTLSVLWGGSFFFVGVAVSALPPLTIVAGRVGIAALVLAVVAAALRERVALEGKLVFAFLVMGVLNGLLPYTLIAWGQTRLESGTAAILNATMPLFSIVLAHFVAGTERLTPSRIGGVTLGVLGVAVLVGPQAVAGLGGNVAACLAALGAAASYGFAAVWGVRLKAVPPVIASAGQIGATALLAVPASLAIDRPWLLSPSPGVIAAVIGLALLSTAFAYLLYFRILAAAGATNVSLVTFLSPISALLLGVLFLHERPGPATYAAMLLIFAGIAMVDGRILRLIVKSRRSPKTT